MLPSDSDHEWKLASIASFSSLRRWSMILPIPIAQPLHNRKTRIEEANLVGAFLFL